MVVLAVRIGWLVVEAMMTVLPLPGAEPVLQLAPVAQLVSVEPSHVRVKGQPVLLPESIQSVQEVMVTPTLFESLTSR